MSLSVFFLCTFVLFVMGIGILSYLRQGQKGLVRFGTIGFPYIWLFLFLLVPLLIMLQIALAEWNGNSVPPYVPLYDPETETLSFTFKNFLNIFRTDWLGEYLFLYAYLNSLSFAAMAAVITLILGYPMAYGIARAKGQTQAILLLLVIIPFWTSFLIRVYAWIGILGDVGLLNSFLEWLDTNIFVFANLIERPIRMKNTDFGVILVIVYTYLPFMILPLYTTLEKMDYSLIEAAQDLGSPPWKTFLTVTLPLSVPGIVAGLMLVFIPAIGEVVIPELLGDPETAMIGQQLFLSFFKERDWPQAAAVAIVMLLIILIPIALFQYFQSKTQEARS